MAGIMVPLASEKVQGVLDDATFTATLCMARDGKHFFFSSIVVDGEVLAAPNKRWATRKAAMQALAEIASIRRARAAKSGKQESSVKAEADDSTADILLPNSLTDDLITEPIKDLPQE